MAKLVGWQVVQVVIGMGRSLGSFRLGGTSIELKLLPLEGFVRSMPRNLNSPGFKNALIYLAGSGIELVLAGAILWAIGPERLLSRFEGYSTIAWQSLAPAATVGGVLNLVPHAVQTSSGQMIPNDGLGILLSLFRPASAYKTLATEGKVGQNRSL